MSLPHEVAADTETTRDRRAAAFGRGYSRFVGLAKRILPFVAVTLLGVVAIWPRLQEMIERLNPEAVLPRLDPRDARDLRMVNVRYTGLDRQNRPFVITAEVARQNPDVDQLVALEGPKGDLTTIAGSWFELTAFSGTYQPDTQLLDLFGDVHLYQDKGDEFQTDSAHINMKDGTGEGHDPIQGQGPFGRITGEGFRILDRGDVIIFTGHAHLDLAPTESPAGAQK
jgi:lipopolysaccharide export system protein LptC